MTMNDLHLFEWAYECSNGTARGVVDSEDLCRDYFLGAEELSRIQSLRSGEQTEVNGVVYTGLG